MSTNVNYEKNRASRAGMTLMEVVIAVSILTVVMGTLFGLATSLGDTAEVQRIRTMAGDEARRTLLFAVRDLRQASRGSITGLPGPTISYRVPEDLDGNGSAVNVGGTIELGPIRTVGRDIDDANGDGMNFSQLVYQQRGDVEVLANALTSEEDTNRDNVLDPGEDKNGNGQLDHGIWFRRVDNSIEITVQTFGQTRQGRDLVTTLRTTVTPRNG